MSDLLPEPTVLRCYQGNRVVLRVTLDRINENEQLRPP